MTFSRIQQSAIKKWVSRAAPLNGLYFRSVEYRYMDPEDVLSGAGTQDYGGRFAAVGTRAVYLSATDSGASKEVTARKARLGGAAQISTSKYPRVVYAVAVSLDRTLDFSDLSSSEPAKAIVSACLSIDTLTASMDLAQILEGEGIHGLVFPSVVAGGVMRWWPDSKFLYHLTNENGPAVVRVRMSDRKVERIASLNGVRLAGFLAGIAFGLKPDGVPIILRDTGTEEIYPLDWHDN